MTHGGLRAHSCQGAINQCISGLTSLSWNFHTQFVVAMTAFGMGIDKPDVWHVIHWGAPLVRDLVSLSAS